MCGQKAHEVYKCTTDKVTCPLQSLVLQLCPGNPVKELYFTHWMFFSVLFTTCYFLIWKSISKCLNNKSNNNKAKI